MEEHERRLALYRQGLTDLQIAMRCGRGPTTIWHWRMRCQPPLKANHLAHGGRRSRSATAPQAADGRNNTEQTPPPAQARDGSLSSFDSTSTRLAEALAQRPTITTPPRERFEADLHTRRTNALSTADASANEQKNEDEPEINQKLEPSIKCLPDEQKNVTGPCREEGDGENKDGKNEAHRNAQSHPIRIRPPLAYFFFPDSVDVIEVRPDGGRLYPRSKVTITPVE